ncbi:MAG: proton-conducting transporter membrane subunit [Acutalibacteraceae bacterium]|nr:proton-conducting transporter membrane subunit [Acutalibacteraceae bacterium]
MEIFIAILILFPFLAALVQALVKNNNLRKITVYISSAAIIVATVVFAIMNFGKQQHFIPHDFTLGGFDLIGSVNYIMLAVEFILMGIIIYLSIKYKKYYAGLLSAVQTCFIAWLELSGNAHAVNDYLFCDNLTLILCLMIAVVGGLICVYAVGYLKDYHHHHGSDVKDRRSFFCSMLFVFLGAMFGIVFSANLIWMYFFWEITSVVSFLLIGYTKTEEAVNNSFRALWMNLLGGVGFAVAIGYAAMEMHVSNLQELVASADAGVVIPLIFLALAALTKSAQLPFSRWLMGAMVAPTPSSALLHSATMVKAGIYLLIRLAPAMTGNMVGLTVALIGGFTFFVASIRAIIHTDGKKVLAYSTISNLGLIVACCGVGINETVWAAIFLMMFHCVSKSLLFQTVGSVEHTSGSRNIEDMHGLIKRYPALATAMMIGIAGMYLAPFGMLISKWSALQAFVDAGNIILVLLLAFGSATTLFYWTKWISKLMAYARPTVRRKDTTSADQWVSIAGHTVIMVALCLVFPFLSGSLVNPIVNALYGTTDFKPVLSDENLFILILMIIVLALVIVAGFIFTRLVKAKKTSIYMSGIDTEDERHYVGSLGEEITMYHANWYLSDAIGTDRLMNICTAVAAAGLIIGMVLTIGGVL